MKGLALSKFVECKVKQTKLFNFVIKILELNNDDSINYLNYQPLEIFASRKRKISRKNNTSTSQIRTH